MKFTFDEHPEPKAAGPDDSVVVSELGRLLKLSKLERKAELQKIEQDDPSLHESLQQRLPQALTFHELLLRKQQESHNEAKAEKEAAVSSLPPGFDEHTITDPPPDLDGYHVVGQFSSGGQAEVYAATQISTEQLVAVKVFSKLTPEDHQSMRRYQQEVSALAETHHSCIVDIIDRGLTTDNKPYLIMSYIDGLDLDKYVKRWREDHPNAPLLATELMQLWFNIADAVAAIHDAKLVHRDLKPSNIMIDNEGRPHILDFGLSTRSDADGVNYEMTVLKTFVGTPKWTTPEQARMARDEHGEPTDIYALGLLLYYIVCGKMPYEFEKNAELADMLHTVINTPATPLRSNCQLKGMQRLIRGSKLAYLDQVLLQALSKRPTDRYDTVRELREDMQLCIDGRKPIRLKKPVKSGRRIPVAISMAACLVLVLCSVALIQRKDQMESQVPSLASRTHLDYNQYWLSAALIDGHAYQIFEKAKTWDEANKFAKQLGGHLVVINDAAEHDNFCLQLLFAGIPNRNRVRYWMGVYRTREGDFTYDDKPITYSAWRNEQVKLNDNQTRSWAFCRGFTWFETPNTEVKQAFAVEWDSIPPRHLIGRGSIPNDAVTFGEHAYQIVTDEVPWSVAAYESRQSGGLLADINSAEEETFLLDLVHKAGLAEKGVWIGTWVTNNVRYMTSGVEPVYENFVGEISETGEARYCLNDRGMSATIAVGKHSKKGYIVKWTRQKKEPSGSR